MDKKMNIVLEGKRMLCCIARAYELYMTNGTRSSKKVDCFHNHIKCELEKIFKKIPNIISFNKATKYVSFGDILDGILAHNDN